ncbi:MAG: hypothetical protein ABSD70_20175 [Terracidiphilus sp.]|jgi:hypothetical protein
MKERGIDAGRIGAIALAVLAAGVSVLLGVHYRQLDAELTSQRQVFAQAKNGGAVAIANRLALPPNRRLAVCNDSSSNTTISSVAAVYIGQSGKPEIYSGANEQWRTWSVPARSRLALGATDWDGSALFYAMNVSNADKSQLLAGVSDDLRSGCIRLPAEGPRQSN